MDYPLRHDFNFGRAALMRRCSFCNHENTEDVPCCRQCGTDLVVATPTRPDAHGSGETIQLSQVPMVQPIEARSRQKTSDHEPAAPAFAQAPFADLPFAESVDSAPPTSTGAISCLGSQPEKIKPYLVVIRGVKINLQYPIYPGKNYIGRTDEKPVDIDLENQETHDRIWTSRQHAVITFENGQIDIEDLNSLNGTFVNRSRVHPGQVRTLQSNDIVQIGTVQMRLQFG